MRKTASTSVESPFGFPARPREDLEILFRDGRQGFAGADGDGSLDIGGGRSLWLFGDTLVGDRTAPGRFTMPRNSVGLLGKNWRGKGFTYYWNQRNGRPSSFFRPERGGEWLWPGTACRAGGGLFFFLRRIRTNSAGISEAFRFKYVGPQLFFTENFSEEPNRWIIRPIETHLARGVVWGSACFVGLDGYVRLWGVSRGNRKPGILAARCALEELKTGCVEHWEYLCEEKEGAKWSTDTTRLRPLFPERPSEISLSYLMKQRLYLAVYGDHRIGDIGVRVARNLEGPWSPYRVIYIAPEMGWNERYICYAPKAHPEMGMEDGELLITYITNSHAFRDVMEDSRIYYPRFVSLPLEDIVREGERCGEV